MSGPQFLLAFSCSYAVALAVSYALRQALSAPHDEAPRRDQELDAYQVAYLAGGKEQAFAAALGSLYHRRAISVQGRKLSVDARGAHLAEHTLEHELLDAIGRGREIEQVRQRTTRTKAPLRRELEKRGLLLPTSQGALVKVAMALPLLIVIGFGVGRLVSGVQAGRPVLFLVGLLVVATLVALGWLGAASGRSVRGDRLLALFKRKNAALKTAVARRRDGVEPEDVARAIGLFGIAVLSTGPLLLLQTALTPPPSTGGSGCGGSSCGGSSCGGGCGGGCGGCGG